MELLYALSLLLVSLACASRYGWTDKGWSLSWCGLFAFAGVLRLSMDWFPEHAPVWGLWLMPALAVIAISLGRWKLSRQQILFLAPLWLFAGLILIRSYFPQFDIDSLENHLSALQWLKDRPHLPELLRHAEVIKSWYYTIGFEEYLSLPGLAGDLGLCAGLVAGVIKVLTLGTLISLIPRQAPLVRYGAAFLLLIDDHFFFSSQSRYIYLNPSLIALTALLVHLSWRGSQGSGQRIWLAAAIALGLPMIKYHGLFFLPIPFVGYVIAFVRNASGKRWAVESPDPLSIFCLSGSLILAWSVFGLHWKETGTPLAPLAIYPFHYRLFYRLPMPPFFLQGSFTEAFAHPFRRLIFPGNLALKMVAVLLLPTWILWGAGWSQDLRHRLHLRWNRVSFASLCFLVSLVWVLLAHAIYAKESRYPRYVMGVAVLGLASIVLARRKPAPMAVKPWTCLGLGGLLFLWLAITLDTRFYNVGPPHRPRWGQIVEFFRAKQKGQRESLDVNAPYLQGLLMDEVQSDLPVLQRALKKLEPQTGLKLTQGEGLLIEGGFVNWPGLLLANEAILVSAREGGGYLKLPDGFNTLKALRIRYLIVPKAFPPDGKMGPFLCLPDGKMATIPFGRVPIAEGQVMKLVPLRIE